MGQAEQQHLDWLARSFGRADYAPLGRDDIDLIAHVGDIVSKHPGTHLFQEGEASVAAYLVERGEVEIYRGSARARRVVARVGPGSMLGDIALFGDRPYISSARAVGAVRAFRFERSRLLPELSLHPAVSMRWLVAGLRQFEETQRRVIRLMHKTVLAQVADLLVEEAERRTEVKLSQGTIANLLGVSRQSVNEALARLRDQGLVVTGYRTIGILDVQGLATVAAG